MRYKGGLCPPSVSPMPNYRRLRIPGGTYFFTVVTQPRLPILCDNGAAEALLSVVEDVRTRLPFSVEAYCILPDHLHVIWRLPEGDADYPRRWALIKLGFLRGLRSTHRSTNPGISAGSIWQRGYWEHCLRDSRDFAAHVDYIHHNPVKHGLVPTPGEWPYSSFRDYVDRGLYPVDWGGSDLCLDRVGNE